MRASPAAVVVLALVLGGCAKQCAPVLRRDPGALPHQPKVVDMHMHISPSELDRTHAIMDEVGIAWGVNLSGMWPGGLLEQQLEAAKRSGRLVVACNLPWHAAHRVPNFPEIAVELLRESKKLGARALKIEKGVGLRAKKPDGTLIAVDDPWLDPIWAEAGALGLPVIIHTGDPKAFWLPSDEKNERLEELTAHPRWSYYGEPGVPSFDALLAQFIGAVKKHPKTTFVGVHFGNNSEDPFWVGRMLEEHPNLNVDIAARVVELGRHDPKKLREVFIKHADRILFGTDLGVNEDGFLMLGSFGEEPNKREEVGPFFSAHYRWLETDADQPSPTPIQGRWKIHGIDLPNEVLEKIYVKNAERLFGPAPTGAAGPTP
jgi:predicted TIM-barrel fold metal-dependent hydrolase